MVGVRQAREQRRISQRAFARRSQISFRTLQLVEAGRANPTLATLDRIDSALGGPGDGITRIIARHWQREQGTLEEISAEIAREGEPSWKLWLFSWVDAFRGRPSLEMVLAPPVPGTSIRLRSLMASTVETLCEEQGTEIPWWCAGAGVLRWPWFVSGAESLKAVALVESPVHFRKRNIFVLGNFLERA